MRSSTVTASIALVALVLSLSSLAGRGSTQASVSNSLQTIQERGVIDVCYGVWPPAIIKDAKTGELSGHDIDAIEYITEQIGVEVRYHEQTFGNMAAALQTGTCDMTLSFFVKIGRSAAVAFTHPLFYEGNSALVRAGDTRFKAVDDMNKPGVRIAVANGESGHIYAKEHLSNATIIPIDVESSDLNRFLLEVTSGRADVGMADAQTIKKFASEHPETTDLFAGRPFDLNANSWAVRHGDEQLLNFLNNALLYMDANGTWLELERKYDAHRLHEIKQYKVL